MGVEFAVDVLEVRMERVNADGQLLRHFFGGETDRHKFEHITLALTERLAFIQKEPLIAFRLGQTEHLQ